MTALEAAVRKERLTNLPFVSQSQEKPLLTIREATGSELHPWHVDLFSGTGSSACWRWGIASH